MSHFPPYCLHCKNYMLMALVSFNKSVLPLMEKQEIAILLNGWTASYVIGSPYQLVEAIIENLKIRKLLKLWKCELFT